MIAGEDKLAAWGGGKPAKIDALEFPCHLLPVMHPALWRSCCPTGPLAPVSGIPILVLPLVSGLAASFLRDISVARPSGSQGSFGSPPFPFLPLEAYHTQGSLPGPSWVVGFCSITG